MKKREIINNDLGQLFNTIVEQAPLISEEQVSMLLKDHPKTNLGSTVNRFFQSHLNTFLLSTIVVVIIVAAFIWIRSGHQSEEMVLQNTPKENLIAPVSSDTISADSVTIIFEESNSKKADVDTFSTDFRTEIITAAAQAEPTISLSDVYEHLAKKPQVFSIAANRDTTIICKEGTTIKINAHSFISEKTENAISGTIQIAVKEYYKMSDIILSNLTTTSGDKILETGGMLHVAASANNENCIINTERDIEIGFPYSNRKDDMDLFYGEQTNDIVDWMLAYPEDDVVVKVGLQIEILNIVDSEPEPETQVYFIVEDMPEYPGGDLALRQYFEQNTKYPYSALKNGIEGKVRVTFVIDKSGYPTNISVAKSLDKTLDKVAVYVVSNMPKWKPGKQRGKPVNVSYTVPVIFLVKKGELNSDDIRQAKELEEKLKNFKFDIETNRYSNNSRIFNELENKVKSDGLQDSDLREVNRYVFSVTQLGWINCDRFYNRNKATTNIFIQAESSNKTIVNAIFRKFKSLIRGRNQSGKISFNNIPLGEEVTIVALKTINNEIFLSVKEIEVNGAGEIVLDFKPVSMELLKKEMDKLNEYY